MVSQATNLEDKRASLRHVRFLGGGSGAGKSTVARRLSALNGLRLYETEPISKYVARTTAANSPKLHAFMRMDMDERWLNRSPEAMFETFHAFHGEQFDLMVEDLLAIPKKPSILAEGFALLPRLIAPLLSGSDQAVWLIPSSGFRRAAFESRGSTLDIASRTSRPEQALANLLARDALFTGQVLREVEELGLAFIKVELGMDVDFLVSRVAAAFDLAAP